jgi:isochorismate hydrolase
MMIERAIEQYVGQYRVTIGILKEHVDSYPVLGYLKEKYGDHINPVILPDRTAGPAHTVREIIARADIDFNQEILIKDCDSFFTHDNPPGNYICVSDIANHEVLKRLASKSFVRVGSHNVVKDIAEKKIISDLFCVGGYKFVNAATFATAYDELSYHNGEIFVSHVIQRCLEQGHLFFAQTVDQYVDVGTAEEWHAYNDLAVIFCDIDGTIVHAQAREEFGEPPTPLVKNIKLIQDMVAQGSQLVFTTARPTERHDEIHAMLEGLGFKNFTLLTGLKNVKRILINDYNHANPYPRAIAVNIPRDSDTIGDFL